MTGRLLHRRRRNAEIPVPPECREMIRRGALVAVNHSGGKDSQAMTILLSRIVPREQTIVVHAPLGEVEWPGTMAHIEATIPEGVPLILAPVTSGKSLLDRIEERGRFPSPSVRWCTSTLKRGPIQRELRRYLKAHPQFRGRLINAMGMRAEESAARVRKLRWRRNDRMSVAGRDVFDWLPVDRRPTLTPPDHVKSKGYRADRRPIYAPINTLGGITAPDRVPQPESVHACATMWRSWKLCRSTNSATHRPWHFLFRR